MTAMRSAERPLPVRKLCLEGTMPAADLLESDARPGGDAAVPQPASDGPAAADPSPQPGALSEEPAERGIRPHE